MLVHKKGWAMRSILKCLILINLCGCVSLYHVQIGEIDQTPGYRLRPFDIKVSEVGFSQQEAAEIASAMATNVKTSETIKTISDIIALFQIGPRTGRPVYNDTYAKKLIFKIHKECPSGRITGLMAIRENRNYPVVSGEIVKITGYCMIKRKNRKVNRKKKNKV